MSIITDGLLIATCLTAALYCIVLSRRLSRFSDTESGIGKQISQLNTILEETRASAKESQSGAKAVSDRLTRDLTGAKKATQDLAAMIARAEAALDRALELQDSPPAARNVSASVRPEPAPDVIEETPTETSDSATETSDGLSPIDEQPHDDIAERDFDLADARGEPQLGFLPNVTDTSAMSDLSFDESAEPVTDQPPEEDEENLLKVERMAL